MEPGSPDLSGGLLETLRQALEQPRKGRWSRGGNQDDVQSLMRVVSLARGYSTSPLPAPCLSAHLDAVKNTLTKQQQQQKHREERIYLASYFKSQPFISETAGQKRQQVLISQPQSRGKRE